MFFPKLSKLNFSLKVNRVGFTVEIENQIEALRRECK